MDANSVGHAELVVEADSGAVGDVADYVAGAVAGKVVADVADDDDAGVVGDTAAAADTAVASVDNCVVCYAVAEVDYD